jgi:hypothetical protein
VWWNDAARHASRDLLRDHDDNTKDLRVSQHSWRFAHAPSMFTDVLRIPREQATTIYRLRTGAEPTIGGWRHEYVDPCPVCGVQLARSLATDATIVSGVRHFFACPRLTQQREEYFGTATPNPSILWQPRSLDSVLKYWAHFKDAADRRGAARAPQPAMLVDGLDSDDDISDSEV